MAVVKADAYGHGAVPVARAALAAGATWCGVALVEEGLELRAAGIEAPILVLSEFPPGAEAVALAHRLTPSLYSHEGLARLAPVARGPVGVHVKVDTGMHRVGVWPPEDLVPYLRAVTEAGLRVEGIWTHLAKSEDDVETTRIQLARFDAALAAADAAGFAPTLRHAANSGGVLRHPEAAYDLVRPGIALFGIAPDPAVRGRPAPGAHLALIGRLCSPAREGGAAELRAPLRARRRRDGGHRAGGIRRWLPANAVLEGRRVDPGPAMPGRGQRHDGPAARGLRRSGRAPRRRGGAPRTPW